MNKRINPNLCKIHRSYSVEEVAELLSVHKNTVRNWIKGGLSICDDMHPMLILGSHLKLFLQQRREVNKKKCKPNEIFCCKCREPRVPVPYTLQFIKDTDSKGSIIGCCSVCNTRMNKYFKLANLEAVQRNYDVTLPLQ